MNNHKMTFIGFLVLLFVFLFNGLTLAEHECSRQVVHSDGTITINTDCTASYTKTSGIGPDISRDPYYLNILKNNLLGGSAQDLQDQTTSMPPSQDNPKRLTVEEQEKAQNTIDTDKEKQQEQEIQLENYKQLHST